MMTFIKKKIEYKLFAMLLLAIVISACNGSGTTANTTEEMTSSTTTPPATAPTTISGSQNSINKNTIDDAAAERIKNFLIDRFLQRDIPLMQEADKQFQLYPIDLNGDGLKEYFVRFQSPYFCGSGGCTLLLLNNDLTTINRFTVMQPPLYISSEKANGWQKILIQSEGAFREMTNEDGKYPENPSVLSASTSVPGPQHTVLFDDKAAPSKTYYFSQAAAEAVQKGGGEQRLTVFQRTYNAGSFVFKVNATNQEVTPIHISTEGLPKEFDQTIEKEAAVKEGHLLDLNNDGFKELYLVLQPTGDSGNLALMGIASYRDKSAGEIYINDTNEIRQVNSDRVFVVNGALRRTFVTDGKEVNYTYELKKGETSFVLEAKRM